MTATRRKTKIICTIGPATGSYEGIQRLYEAGMSVVRLNMSHATLAEAGEMIHWVKTLNRKVRYPMPIILDTQGPEIRTGPINEPLVLYNGQRVFLDVEPQPPGDAPSIEVNYPDLADSVTVGDRVRLDNGLINLRVVAQANGRLECRVADGGKLGSRKHVNLPGIAINLASITAKDHEDIAFGVAQDIDYIALSFVRSADDIAELRALLGPRASRAIQVIAKIENTEGVRNAEEIAQAADGVMVARGDLGIETDIATLPIVQRRLAEICARLGKRCIIATHLMESMIENPIPTRAEVTDVANAVYEGADAVMLSGETSIGAYPYRCVEQLANIAQASELQRGFALHESLATNTAKQHLATSATRLAEAIHAAGIVVITRRGITADLVTNCHPEQVPVFAFTNTSQTRRRLMLNRGVFAYRTSFSNDPEKTIQTALAVLRDREAIGANEFVVVISDVLAEKAVDAIQLRTVGEG